MSIYDLLSFSSILIDLLYIRWNDDLANLVNDNPLKNVFYFLHTRFPQGLIIHKSLGQRFQTLVV